MSIALIAGTGRLPALLQSSCEVTVGIAGEVLEVTPDMELRFETLGSVAKALAREHDAVCLAGGVGRPVFDPSKIDADTAPLLLRLTAAMNVGDDAALRTVIAIFEEAGLEILGADDLRPELLAGPDLIVGAPSDRDRADAIRGAAILDALSAADVGQSCVVAQGLCLAVEALPGTDHMLSVVAGDLAGRRPTPSRGKGVLVKRAKAGQDLRVDRPAIGPETVTRAAEAGLAGIAIGPEVLMLGRKATMAAAQGAGIALWSLG